MAQMKFEDWAAIGVEQGWISPSFCMTHDGDAYMTNEEEKEWEDGGDPCCVVFKILEQDSYEKHDTILCKYFF